MDTTADRQSRLAAILTAAPVVPVLTIEDRRRAVPLARALVAGGLTALEVTLRTADGLECIRAIAGEVEGADVGAGTVLDAGQYAAVAKAGARFVVSPGATPRLLAAAKESPVPFLPGAATAGEAMALAEAGYTILKFFPAEPAGGLAYLKALGAPLPAIRFCPTGGVSLKNAPAYLGLANVICVGGSWVAPAEALAAGDWARVTQLAREAAALRRG
jgi:2-dehydro-3-deoxyphosphogluconate aldolase/(4S)-4-hydroxy-2-oxoglutarate aldolase